ncbi:5-formyltetrahydrofolate cyclo-ligase [Aquibacillus sp. 3ASR75-11]|uniref:5-formyltetrahydrofolate cyclo-ligase n=1 Tax=Terrihalobacillus insolitus TaxID=2950438 RepID=A0A9X3WVH1_9BACI|nr:5-formyltetrahydrofolate cyclo-ligase [Terrihalobacillus insolitus]MDC3413388.1 5-formyltetrahydrofolate cyclo-ligase [Terrihalobacillus insolitus]MDC3424971.1 5-formyltetrahydrofolate cyclo-ligase [Terrihalobacillus insolitus]
MDKHSLRDNAKKYVHTLKNNDKETIEKWFYHDLFATSYWKNASSIGITISRRHEWNTIPIVKKAWEQNKTVSVPKCFPEDKRLVFYQITSMDQLERVYMDLLEPIVSQTIEINCQDIDLLIVPGLLFDSHGFRIGYGGGYYDRYLKNYPNETVSLASTNQLIEKVPTDQYDIPVDHLITNMGLLF